MDYNEDTLITLTDEEGKEQAFEIIYTYEENGNKYHALIPYIDDDDEQDDEDETEVLILQVEFNENGEEDALVTIDDDAEYERIGNIMIQEIYHLSDDE